MLPILIAFGISLAYSFLVIWGIKRKVDLFTIANWFVYGVLIAIMAILGAMTFL